MFIFLCLLFLHLFVFISFFGNFECEKRFTLGCNNFNANVVTSQECEIRQRSHAICYLSRSYSLKCVKGRKRNVKWQSSSVRFYSSKSIEFLEKSNVDIFNIFFFNKIIEIFISKQNYYRNCSTLIDRSMNNFKFFILFLNKIIVIRISKKNYYNKL